MAQPNDQTPVPQTKEQTPQTKEQNAAPSEKLTVRISRYQPFVDIVSSERKIINVALLITLIACLVFMGLLTIVLTVKRIYPYNDIQTNALGAMTIKDESKEVTYWLFNTAELWANSGIAVKKGDVLTIRASGLSHSAIHHLVQDAEYNRMLRDPWSTTEGFNLTGTMRDPLRAKWRIIPHQRQDALLMQVIPGGFNNSGILDERYLTASYTTSEGPHCKNRTIVQNDIYLIGKERTELLINQDGILHFTVNDIVLTPDVIYNMVVDNLRCIAKEQPEIAEEFINKFNSKIIQESAQREGNTALFQTGSQNTWDSYRKLNNCLFKALEKETKLQELYKKNNHNGCYNFGPCYDEKNNDTLENLVYQNEMVYYNDLENYPFRKKEYPEETVSPQKGYYQAWFDDNVGSFLIVVERKK